MPPRGFVTSRNLLINAGICFASAAPIGSPQDPDESQQRPRQQVEGYLQ